VNVDVNIEHLSYVKYPLRGRDCGSDQGNFFFHASSRGRQIHAERSTQISELDDVCSEGGTQMSIDFGLQGKGAVVAGAGYIPERAGHGRVSSLLLAEAGGAVACIDIDKERAEGIVAEIKAAGGKAFPVVADMTEPAEVSRAVAESVAGLGSIDICVDIIGGARWDRLVDFSPEDWNWTIRNNLGQVFYLFQAVGRQMIEQASGGSMVAIASVDGINAAAMHGPYGAAKAGVISLAKTFAQELGRYGIRVNAVAPGNVGSGNEDWPEGQWAVDAVNPLAPPRSHDIGNAVLFLASTLAERITGQTLVVDGGAVIKDLWGMNEDVMARFRSGNYG
jgi:NAD(P)-dependent dehydrogenase (short-subunit alcohol dehydrogenase family)